MKEFITPPSYNFDSMKKWAGILMGILTLAGCAKTINIQPDLQEPKLVVEAQIESGQAPIVVLSTSLNYFSEIDPVVLANSYVHGAKITLSDGSKTVLLNEITSRQVSPGKSVFLDVKILTPAEASARIKNIFFSDGLVIMMLPFISEASLIIPRLIFCSLNIIWERQAKVQIINSVRRM